MNQNSIQLIEKPTAKEVLELERALRGERLEMFQEAFDVLHEGKQADNDPAVKWRLDNIPYLYRGFKRVDRETKLKDTRPAGVLHINVNKGDVKHELGLASVNQVTNIGAEFVIDSIQALSTISELKYHQSGEGNSPEGPTNNNLVTPRGARVPGSQGEPDPIPSLKNVYQTTATLAYTSVYNIEEHGLFWANTGDTLFDRSVFTAIPVDTSTSIEFTYTWTLNAGG